MKLIVIDDFYKDPEKVRDLALRSKYVDVTELNYPGFQSKSTFYSNRMVEKIAKYVHGVPVLDQTRLTFGKFRIMLEESTSCLKIHLDGAADWTGVLYLNPPHQCSGGTAFFKHNRTGFDKSPTPRQLKEIGLSSMEEFERIHLRPDSLDSSLWEQTMFVAMKFNRLVLFKGNELFHSHTHSFGKSFYDGRMTQNFFFDVIDK